MINKKQLFKYFQNLPTMNCDKKQAKINIGIIITPIMSVRNMIR